MKSNQLCFRHQILFLNTDMSGYASYEDALDPKYGEPFPVPVVMATAETLKGYGVIVTDFENEKVEITPWPVKGKGPSPTFNIY